MFRKSIDFGDYPSVEREQLFSQNQPFLNTPRWILPGAASEWQFLVFRKTFILELNEFIVG